MHIVNIPENYMKLLHFIEILVWIVLFKIRKLWTILNVSQPFPMDIFDTLNAKKNYSDSIQKSIQKNGIWNESTKYGIWNCQIQTIFTIISKMVNSIDFGLGHITN